MIKAFSLVILLLSLSASSQTTVELEWDTRLPDVDYKRGTAAPGVGGFFDSDKMRDYLDYQSSIGMEIFNGIRNIFKDPETNEFYYEDGEYKNQQIPEFTNIRKYAHNLGFELISQVGGTPRNSNYEFDSTYYKVLPWGPWTDFAPLPALGESMTQYQKNFSEWAINADKAVGDDFHSIWIGTQEIAHTLGFQGGNKNATLDNKKLNVRRWIEYWKPISDNLRAAGAKTGGIQLNSSNTNIYNYAVDYMIQKQLHMDYITYQFYQWGDTSDLLAAVEATKRYAKVYPGTKLIVDRGHHDKIVPDGFSGGADALGVIYFLVGELGLMNHANWVYAYTPDRQVNGMESDANNLLWKTKEWINTIGKKRCSLNGLPAGVDGFAVHNGNKVSIALWNRGSSTQNFDLKINNALSSSGDRFIRRHARSKIFIPTGELYDKETQTIKNI